MISEVVDDDMGEEEETDLVQWRRDYYPLVMALVIQSYRRKQHSYGLEAIYLLRNLYSNYRDKKEQSLPKYIESKLAIWKYGKKWGGTFGYRFLHQDDKKVSEHLHSIQVSCRLANAQLREWNSHLTKPTEGSMMYEVKFANKLRDKGWPGTTRVVMR